MTDRILREYRLLQRLGAGAAGEVFLATPVVKKPFAREGKPLAIKVYKEVILEQPNQLERVRREFTVGSTLIHPNLVRIHELKREDSRRPFLVMEFVDGMPLSKWISMFHPIPGGLLLRITEQLVAGLKCLHEADVIHRDLKPANIMLTSSFDARIMDFGVVHVTSDTKISDPDKFLGTIRNSSPELLRGGSYDHRTDLYSLGTVLFALLQGEEVFAEEEQFFRLGERVCRDMPRFDRAVTSGDQVCGELLGLAKDLLQKDPALRPQTVHEVEERLRPVRRMVENAPPDEPLHGYIATALTGLSKDARGHITFASSQITNVAKQHGFYLYQPRIATDPVLHKEFDAETVYRLDRQKVENADLLFVLLNMPSFGVGQELEIAASFGKPTVLLVEEATVVSRMVLGSPANVVGTIAYSTPEDLTRKLHKLLSDDELKRVVATWRSTIGSRRGTQILGPRIKELRIAAGYQNAMELAKVLGVAESLIKSIEGGELENVGAVVLEQICAALGTSAGSVLQASGTPATTFATDPNIRHLGELARRLRWSAEDYLTLRTEFEKELAASGRSENLSDEDWMNRRNTLERRRLEHGTEDKGPLRLL